MIGILSSFPSEEASITVRGHLEGRPYGYITEIVDQLERHYPFGIIVNSHCEQVLFNGADGKLYTVHSVKQYGAPASGVTSYSVEKYSGNGVITSSEPIGYQVKLISSLGLEVHEIPNYLSYYVLAPTLEEYEAAWPKIKELNALYFEHEDNRLQFVLEDAKCVPAYEVFPGW